MHLQDTADALFLALRRVVDVGTSVERTGVDAEERELADERIRHDLEREGRERLLIARRTMVFLTRLRVHTSDRRDIRRRRHEVDDGIEQGLYALVAVGRTAGHGDHLAGDRRLADDPLDVILGDVLAAEVLLHEVVVLLGASLEQLLAVLFRLLFHVVRDGDLIFDLAEIVLIDDGFHLDEIDDALERVLRADRQLDGNCVRLEALMHHLDDIVEICASDVHLVDIRHARNVVLLSLAPYGFRLGLDAAACGQDRHSAIEDAQGALDLYRKVHMARRINDVDTMAFPMASRRSGRDRDAALLLLDHPVHRRSAVMHLTNLVVDTRVEEDTLSSRRLTGIDVCHDTDIPSFFKGILSCHFYYRSLSYIVEKITSDNVQMPCWPLPSYAYLPSS